MSNLSTANTILPKDTITTNTHSIAMSEICLPIRDEFGEDNDGEDLVTVQTGKIKMRIVP